MCRWKEECRQEKKERGERQKEGENRCRISAITQNVADERTGHYGVSEIGR